VDARAQQDVRCKRGSFLKLACVQGRWMI
jgi:hypothetical protein